MTAELAAETKTFPKRKVPSKNFCGPTLIPGSFRSLILFLLICVSPCCRLILTGLSDRLTFTLILCNYSAVCIGVCVNGGVAWFKRQIREIWQGAMNATDSRRTQNYDSARNATWVAAFRWGDKGGGGLGRAVCVCVCVTVCILGCGMLNKRLVCIGSLWLCWLCCLINFPVVT